MTEKLPDVWTSRDYPVLLEVARRMDSGEHPVNTYDVAMTLNVPVEQVALAGAALERRGLVRTAGSYAAAVEDFLELSGEAYLLTGLHPSGDDAVSAFVQALRQAADLVDDPAEKSRLRNLADHALGLSRDVLGGVLTAVATTGVGLGS